MKFSKLLELEYRRYLSNKALFIVMLILPIVLITGAVSLMSYISGSNLKETTIAVVNNDPGQEMDMFLELLKNTDSVKENATILELDYNEAVDSLEEDNIDMVVVVPEGFTSNIYYGRESSIEIIHKDSAINNIKTTVFKKVAVDGIELGVVTQGNLNIMKAAMQEAGYSKEEIRETYNKNAKNIILNIANRNKMFDMESEDTNIIYFSILFLIAFIYLNSLVVFVVTDDERSIGLLDRLKINNVDKKRYTLSKFIISTALQVLLYGIPLSILMISNNSFTLLAVISIVLICICSNLLIYLIAKVTRKKSVTVIIGLALIIFWTSKVGELHWNTIESSTYLLMDIINGGNLENLFIMIISTIILFILNFGVHHRKGTIRVNDEKKELKYKKALVNIAITIISIMILNFIIVEINKSTDINNASIALIDLDNSGLSQEIYNSLDEKINIIKSKDINSSMSKLAEGKVESIVVINKGYEEELKDGEFRDVFTVYTGYNLGYSKLLLEIISEETLQTWIKYKIIEDNERHVDIDFSKLEFLETNNLVSLDENIIEDDGIISSNNSGGLEKRIYLGLMLIIILSNIIIDGRGIIKDKTSGVIKRVFLFSESGKKRYLQNKILELINMLIINSIIFSIVFLVKEVSIKYLFISLIIAVIYSVFMKIVSCVIIYYSKSEIQYNVMMLVIFLINIIAIVTGICIFS